MSAAPATPTVTPGGQPLPHSDALVVFGFTGDLANKQIFPTLYRMVKSGELTVSVVGVASSSQSLDEVHARVRASLEQAGKIDDTAAFDRLLGLISYVGGDYKNPATFDALKTALGAAKRPAHYLAIPPSLFETVIKGLGAAGLANDARVIVEKPYDSQPSDARANYVRFKLQPVSAVVLAARTQRPGKGFLGDQRELFLCEEALSEGSTYERLLSDTMDGDGALFATQDAVEAAWKVVDAVLVDHHPALPYAPGTWGPAEADALIAADGGWHTPAATEDGAPCA